EDWALSARDRGPAKRLVRDYVDAHRRPMEYYMYALVVLLIALFAGSRSALSNFMSYFLIIILAILVVDGILLRRSVLRAVAERLAGGSRGGLGYYAITRGLQLRRFRTPSPRVKPGDEY